MSLDTENPRKTNNVGERLGHEKIVPRPHSTTYVIERLKILRRKLEHDGYYVRSYTITLAIEEIEFLKDRIETLAKSERGDLSTLQNRKTP